MKVDARCLRVVLVSFARLLRAEQSPLKLGYVRPSLRHAVVLTLAVASGMPAARAENRMWYREPATTWGEALPVGNGRLGAMVFGDPVHEKLQLNESSLWSGQPGDYDREGAHRHLAEVRQLLFEGKVPEAEALVNREFLGERPLGSYQPLGDLELAFTFPGAVSDYRRELDLERAVVRTSFRAGGVAYLREVFASAPDQVIVVRLTADQPGKISFCARLQREAGGAKAGATPTGLTLDGQADANLPTAGVCFAARLHAEAEGGRMTAEDDVLRVENADAVVLRFAAATNFNEGDPAAACARQLAEAARHTYAALKGRHGEDHAGYFRRVQLTLGADAEAARPTDERVARVRAGAHDAGLASLYFQYGRYLLIASSRAGGLPANLQGLWNDDPNPPWFCGWHFDINAQMNYWLAETGALGELHTPLFDLIDRLRENGRRTAREVYGARGFVTAHRTNLWAFTSPVKGLTVWPVGAAWLCQHLWEHYQFSGDREFLGDRAYPAMKEAAEFFLDWLVIDPRNGRLVSGPSVSPENSFRLSDGRIGALDMGPAMDQQIVAELFDNVLAAAKELGIRDAFVDAVAKARPRLAGSQIGPHGRLLEWSQDWREREPGHRHMSHLYAVHPGSQITPRGTPELAEAAVNSLAFRVSGGGTTQAVNLSDASNTGWSLAWNAGLWARLAKPAQAHDAIHSLLARCVFPNLMDGHPRKGRENVFQIDGNLGGAAAMIEMLLQSHAEEIELLPALPAAWPEGSFSGLRARGGFAVGAHWAKGRLRGATLRAERAAPAAVRAPVALVVSAAGHEIARSQPHDGSHRVRFAAEAGVDYELQPADQSYR